MFKRFKSVIIAAALGILPYFLFLGSSSTTRINGEVVRDEQFNLLGVILAAIGISIAIKVLRTSVPGDPLRAGLAVVAALICVLQLAASFDMVRPLEWLGGDSVVASE